MGFGWEGVNKSLQLEHFRSKILFSSVSNTSSYYVHPFHLLMAHSNFIPPFYRVPQHILLFRTSTSCNNVFPLWHSLPPSCHKVFPTIQSWRCFFPPDAGHYQPQHVPFPLAYLVLDRKGNQYVGLMSLLLFLLHLKIFHTVLMGFYHCCKLPWGLESSGRNILTQTVWE